jgi:hypothetical protein
VNRGGLTGAPVEALTPTDNDRIDEETIRICHGKDPSGEKKMAMTVEPVRICTTTSTASVTEEKRFLIRGLTTVPSVLVIWPTSPCC